MVQGLILNTRPTLYHERFHDAFGDLDWAIFDCPVTIPVPLGVSIPAPAAFDSVIFTSQVAIALFPGSGAWQTKRIYVVGSGTEQAARAGGFVDVVRTGLNVDDMRRYLAEASFGAALYPSAEEVSADLAAEFPGRIQRVAIYKTVPRADLPGEVVRAALQGTPILAPVFSRRSAAALAELLVKSGISAENAQITAVGISADVFAGDGGPWQRRVVAEQPTLAAMVDKTRDAIESHEA